MLDRRTLLIGCLAPSAWALSGCGGMPPGPSAEAPPSGSDQVPVSYEEPHLSVEVQVNGSTRRFVLDTGSDATVVTPKVAADLGLPVSNQPATGEGSGGVVEVRSTRIDDFAIGGARLRHDQAYVVAVPETFPWDGVVGANFFRRFVPRLDYSGRTLTLTLADRFVAPAGVVRLPGRLVNGGRRMLVQARIAGHEGWFAVDTGAFNAITVHTPSADRLGLRTLGRAVRMITGQGAGGVTRGDVARLPELQIGPWRLPHVVTELSLATSGAFANDAWMGNLGSELFRRFTVTTDLAGAALYLEPNNALYEPFPAPRSGLYMQWADGEAEVIEVLADGPAAAAGIGVQDRVLSIDGRALDAAGWSQHIRRLKATPGTEVTLRVASPGSAPARDARLVLRELV